MNTYTFTNYGMRAAIAAIALAVALAAGTALAQTEEAAETASQQTTTGTGSGAGTKPRPLMPGEMRPMNTNMPKPDPRMATSTTSGPNARGGMAQGREEIAAKIMKIDAFEDRMKTLQGKRTEKKEDLRTKLTTDKRETLSNTATKLEGQLGDHIARISENAAKIESIILSLKGHGKNVSAAETEFAEAKTLIEQAKKDVITLSTLVKTNTATSTSVTKEVALNVRDAFKVAHKSIQDAHQALQDVFPALRTLRGEGKRPATTTPAVPASANQ